MSLTIDDLLKIRTVVREEVRAETSSIPWVSSRFDKIEDDLNGLKDIFLQFKRQYDQDYGFLG